MGFRTVVVLSNDRASEWMKDPNLGKKIFHAGSCGSDQERAREYLPYGTVVEQVHADTQTLAVLDGYDGHPVAHTHWYRGQQDGARELALLKALADKLGYRIVKKAS